MIEAFGSYHRVFWNCQTFAICFLKVICEGRVSFDSWTAADVSNLVTLPIASLRFSLRIGNLVRFEMANGSFFAPLW